MKTRAYTLIEIMIVLAVVAIIGALLFGGLRCSDRPGAARALHGMGFTNIQLADPEFWSVCGRDDAINHRFTAQNSAGQTVSGTVCCGGPMAHKGCTVRF